MLTFYIMSILPEIIYYLTYFCDTLSKQSLSLVSKEWRQNIQWTSKDQAFYLMRRRVNEWVTTKRKTRYLKGKIDDNGLASCWFGLQQDNTEFIEKKNLKYLTAISFIEKQLAQKDEYGRYTIETSNHIISNFLVVGTNITRVSLILQGITISVKHFLKKKDGICYKNFTPLEFGIPKVSIRFNDIALKFNEDANIYSIFCRTYLLTGNDCEVLKKNRHYSHLSYEKLNLSYEYRTFGGMGGFGYDSYSMSTPNIRRTFFNVCDGDEKKEKIEKFIDKTWRGYSRIWT